MYKIRVCLPFVAVVACFAGAANAQNSEIDQLRGELRGDSPLGASRAVTLTEIGNYRVLGSADVSNYGTFEMSHVPLGTYRLTVTENGNREVYAELVTITSQTHPLYINLPLRQNRVPAAGPVSLTQLLHPPAKKAIEAFKTARKFSEAGDRQNAVAELQRAVEISPEFAEAWVNLGAQHLRMGLCQPALEELQRAAAIAPPTAMLLGNISYAQNGLHREADAIKSARMAIQLDSSYAPAHYLLGSYLASDLHTVPEAIHHLEMAARTIPSAQALLDSVRQQLAQTVTETRSH